MPPPANVSPAPTSSADPDALSGKGAQTRRAILAAAIIRFGRDGYRSTSVADIARDAGVGGTVAYKYFPSKEALFLAALDEDAASVISDGAQSALDQPAGQAMSASLIATLVEAMERHPLARRVLAGLEPHVTYRMLEIPALAELRKGLAERLRTEQLQGTVRPDVDPSKMANGTVTLTLSILMSVLQFGDLSALPYAEDVLAVFQAAVGPVDRV